MKFKNVILEFPPEIRAEVDNAIETQQLSGRAIYRMLKDKYSNVIAVPSLPTVIKYIRHHTTTQDNVKRQLIEEKTLYNLEDGVKEVTNVHLQVSRGEEPHFQKIKLLEGLAGKCIHRIHALEDLISNVKKPDPAVENVIVRYVSTIKDVLQSVAGMSSTKESDERVVIQMVRTEARQILNAVRSIILEICPENYDLFKEKLQVRLKDYGITSQAQQAEKIDDTPKELSEPQDHQDVIEAVIEEASPEPVTETAVEEVTVDVEPITQIHEQITSEPQEAVEEAITVPGDFIHENEKEN